MQCKNNEYIDILYNNQCEKSIKSRDTILYITITIDNVIYAHIMDDDRRLNAERLEEAFYGGKSEKPENSSPGDIGVSDEAIELAKAIGNSPELMALLKGLLKNNN